MGLRLLPVRDGFRAHYIVEPVPLRTPLIDLALALPVVGFVWGLLILTPRG